MPGKDCERCLYNRGQNCTRGNYTYYQEVITLRPCPYFELDFTR